MVNKVDANFTGLRYAKEVQGQPGVLPGEEGNSGSPIWLELEPNSYSDFGAEVTTTARSPITAGRQKKKGRVTDLDANGGFQIDFTGNNMVDLLDTFMFADWRAAPTLTRIESVTAATDRYTKTGAFASGFAVGDLVFASGFVLDANNGLKAVAGVNDDYLTVGDGLVDEAATVQPADLAGYVFDITITADGDNGYGDDVEVSYTAEAGDDIDDVGTALVALLAAHTPAVTATYTSGTDVIEIAGSENAGDSVITATVTDPQGYVQTGMAPTVEAATGTPTDPRDITLTPAATAADYIEYGKLQRIGVQSAAGDLDVDVTTDPLHPALTSTTLDFTDYGLIPGQWVYIGGDAALTRFTNAGNNGFARVFSVAANRLAFDKTQNTMVTEANTAQTVRLFFPDLIKNEADPDLIVTKTVQFERKVVVGYEYLMGSHGNELTINMQTADKITVDMAFVSFDADPTESRKPGSFPPIRTAPEAFNTTSDVVRIRASKQGSAAPLFGFVQEMSLSINNNVEPLKAIGVLGAFDASIGDFEVTGDITAYFNDIEAVQAVRNSDSLSIDFALAFDNQGWLFDVPLFTGSNGMLNVEKDQAITIPVGIEAAEDPDLHTTLIVCWFPYLPSVAMAN
jgi:hypothetical protein